MPFYLGCAVWAYRGWLGNFYPAGSRSGDFLRLYGQRLTAVEGNTTFYSTPSPQTVARWAAATPLGFKFFPKLPQKITHQGNLAAAMVADRSESIARAQQFVELMQGLNVGAETIAQQRLGAIFAQLPPSYAPAQLSDLAAFLATWPRQTPLAVEVRHPAWFDGAPKEQLQALLEEHGVSRVLLDTRPIYAYSDDPQRTSQRRKPELPLQISTTAPQTFVRFISHPDLEKNQVYLLEWVEQVRQWLAAGITVYFFVHCPDESQSPLVLRHFQDLLETHQVPVPPLPWNLLDVEPVNAQLSLF